MTWKDILKAPLSEREMAEVKEFMPEEMPIDPKLRVRRRKPKLTYLPAGGLPERPDLSLKDGKIQELERRLQSVKSAPPGLQRRSALQLLRDAAEKAGMPDAATKSLADISNFVRTMKVRNKDNSYSGNAA